MFPPPPPWSSRIYSVGVTGTNGKTTTTAYLAHALGWLHEPVLRVTTVGSFLGPEKLDVAPDYEGFMAGMERALAADAKMAVLECTSEALAAGFARAWPVSMGVFTNLSQDHLDRHGSPEHYLASKAQLFLHLPSNGIAVLNAYDSVSALLTEIIPPGVRVVSYGLPSRAPEKTLSCVDVAAASVDVRWTGTHVKLQSAGCLAGLNLEMHLRAVGEIYAENALAALAAAISIGVPAEQAVRALEETPLVPGRFEVVGMGPRAVVDYGHSPDALERTLRTARALCSGQLTVVFGAGGGRDRGKREAMGRAARMADNIVLTSDNPRHEDPAAIAAEIRRGIATHPNVVVMLDRERAIKESLENARAEDVVVVAGRGPETMQVFASENRRLVDMEIVRHSLRLHECA